MKRVSLSNMVLGDAPQPRDFVKRGKPRWLKMQLPHTGEYHVLKKNIQTHGLHTVCEEARCPNMGECWSHGVATIMILGDTCTRSCGFCNIKTGKPTHYDLDEPRRVGESVALMGLKFLCITSVNRDELADGGAKVWAESIREIRKQAPGVQIEALVPDFCGDWDALQMVLDAGPDVLNHTLETVPRMYRVVRPQAKYERSLELLRRAKEQGFVAKTGIMVGIGERDEEVLSLMQDVLEQTDAGEGKGPCDIVSIGQYLQPTANHLPVNRFVHPDQFAEFKRAGEAMGLTHVESGPMVRSSYHADQQAAKARASM